MKILLLARQIVEDNETFVTAGWIQSLLDAMAKHTDWQIGFVCLTKGESSVQKQGNTTIYKISLNRSKNPFIRVFNNITGKVDSPKWSDSYLTIVNDFEPDLVQIFGTETFIVDLIPKIPCKVVVHIQGLLCSYLNAWYPPLQISKTKLFCNSFNWLHYLKGQTQTQAYRVFKRMAERESNSSKYINYCMGRTDWDKSVIKSLNKNTTYFHVEEMLRPQFYEAETWKPKDRKTLKLISVLSPSIYKGFDVILKTSTILKKLNIEFEWSIYGTTEHNNVVQFFDKTLKLNHRNLNIHYKGVAGASELISSILDSDIFVHPSYIENSPNSVCEAQLLGIPVVATNVGGVSSLIENNKTGLLVPANDPYYLASKLIELSKDKTTVLYLSENERLAASVRHNRENIIETLKLVYNQMFKD